MKKYLFPLSTVLVILLYYSCTKDVAKPAVPPDCSHVDSLANTYTQNIKSILDYNCAYSSCHDAASAESGVDLSSYATAVDAFKTKNVICSVLQTGCEPMPQDGTKLADSLITYMQCWSANGYPQ